MPHYLARLAEEEGLHPILKTLVQDGMDRGVPALRKGDVGEGVEDLLAHVQVEGVARGL